MDSTNQPESTRIEPTTAQVTEFIDTFRVLFDRRGQSLSNCCPLEAQYTNDVRDVPVLASEENIQADPVWRLRSLLERLDGLEQLDRNWDSYASEPPTPEAVAKARSLVWDVVGAGFAQVGARAVPFSIAPVSGAGLQVEWRGEHDSIEVEVGPDGAFGFLLAKGHGPEREFEEANAVPENEIVRRTLAAIS